MKITIVHLEGSKQGQTESLAGPVITVGRDPSCELAFDPYTDLDVSSRHATITFQGDGVMIQDLGSRNGTFVNGTKISAAMPLPQGATVQFGDKGPKITVNWSTGPGKKTMMIQDLSSKLESADAAQQKAKKKGKVLALVFVLLALLGVGGGVAYTVHSNTEAAKARVADLKTAAGKARDQAQESNAQGDPKAKEAFAAALVAYAAGEEAEKAGEWATAEAKLKEASDGFDRAEHLAVQAEIARTRASADAARDAASKAAREQTEAMQKELDRIKAEQEEKLKQLQQNLQGAETTAALAQQLASVDKTNPEQVDRAIAAIQAQIEAARKEGREPDPELLKQLEAFQKAKEQVGNVGEKLAEAATKAKPSVVNLRAHVYAIPRGQRPDTTNIRQPVAEGIGTGFFVSADGKILTAKEVVAPQLFDPKALALKTKLEERGWTLHTELELIASVAGIYTTTHTSPAVTVVRMGPDSLGDPQKVTIDFERAKTEVQVRPHRRDIVDLAVVKVDGITGHAFLELGDALSSSMPIVVLGTQQGGPGLEARQTGLFQFTGKVGEPGKRAQLQVASFPSWVGGPVLNATGKVVALLVESGVESSHAVVAAELKEILLD